jgi:hypothetical protein
MMILLSDLTTPTCPMEGKLFHTTMVAPIWPMQVMFFYYHSVTFDPQIECILIACHF